MEKVGKMIDQNRKDRLFLCTLGFIYFLILFLQIGISLFVTSAGNTDISELEKGQLISIFLIICSLLKVTLSVEFVAAGFDIGFWVQLGLNVLNVVFGIVFAKHSKIAYTEIGFSIVGVVISSLVLREKSLAKMHLNHIQNLAFLDDLTGLPNRKDRFMTVERMIKGPNPVPVFTLIQFDIDNFRMMNDYWGYQIGDTYITEVAHNIMNCIKAPNSIGRLAGDGFLIILPGSHTESEIINFISELQGALDQPFYFRDQEYKSTACFGISRYPKDATDPVQLIQQAELAMYKAKDKGKNKVMFFDEEMQDTLEYHIRYSRELENAIARNELFVEYQPVYAVRNKKLRGFEVLARWASKSLGYVAPVNFIPLAEENGSIVEIGRWIFKEACSQYTRLFGNEEEKPILAVNISVVQLRDPRFIEGVEKVLSETKMEPQYLEFEITESICISNPTMTQHLLNELKRLGIRISLDDFGTGYSSLSYLRTLPFDIVKIDKSFVDTIGIVEDSKNIVANIINMAHQLDLHVIAEGVENQKQFDYLLRHGCDYIQGNFLGKPIVAAGL